MTVGELIAKLSTLDPTNLVVMQGLRGNALFVLEVKEDSIEIAGGGYLFEFADSNDSDEDKFNATVLDFA